MSQRDQNLQPELAPRQQTGSRATLPLRTTIELIRHQHRAALLDTPHGTTVQQAAVLDGEPLRQHDLHSLRAVQLLLRGHSPTSRRPLLPTLLTAHFRGLPLLFSPQRIGRVQPLGPRCPAQPLDQTFQLRHPPLQLHIPPTNVRILGPQTLQLDILVPLSSHPPLLQNPPHPRITSFRRMDGYLAHAVRSHWSIENTCHWSLDITYREDESRIREAKLRENFAWLSRFSLSL